MKLVLLPGMDGTGLLFKPLLNVLPDSIDAEIIDYSPTKQQNYDELVEEVKSKLPNKPFVLLAESFSGRVAFQLSLDTAIPIKKLILVASFLSNPLPKWGRFIRMLPLTLLLKIPVSKFILTRFCFERNCSDDLLSLFHKSIVSVRPNVLAFRLRQILKALKPTMRSEVNCLVIIGRKDRLISQKISVAVGDCFENSRFLEIEGPHFLAQTNSKAIIIELQKLG